MKKKKIPPGGVEPPTLGQRLFWNPTLSPLRHSVIWQQTVADKN